MTSEYYYIGAYWGARLTSVEECSQQIVGLLSRLSIVDESLSRWFKTGKTRRNAFDKIPYEDFHGVLHILQSYATKYRSADIGYRIALWNGKDVSLDVVCGCHNRIPGVNSCVIRIPFNESTEVLLTTVNIVNMIASIVASFDPDWCVVNSSLHNNITPKPEGNAPIVGWMLYLSDARGSIPDLPEDVQVMALDHGSLIILVNELFTATNPTHLQIASRVKLALEQVGLLGPLRHVIS